MPSFDLERAHVLHVAERELGDASDRLHARQRGKASEELRVERHPLRRGRIAGQRKRHAYGQAMIHVETRIDGCHARKAPGQQSGTDENGECQRQLRGDEPMTSLLSTAAA